jgi:hypothetical protein
MRPSLCVLLLVAACGADGELAADDYMDEDFPPWTCDTEGTTGPCDSTGELTSPSCQETQDCSSGVCAASFNGNIGPLECQSTCIEAMDDARWCSDAQACCDGTAICDRGYCVPTDGGSSGVDSTGTDASGADSTGADSTGADSTGTDSTGADSTGGGTTDSTGTGA